MKSKLDAYRAAGFASVSDQAASSNASKLEREVPAIGARIAYLSRDRDALIGEKRKRLEERLWLYHDGNVRTIGKPLTSRCATRRATL
jgi:hypothetical protein